MLQNRDAEKCLQPYSYNTNRSQKCLKQKAEIERKYIINKLGKLTAVVSSTWLGILIWILLQKNGFAMIISSSSTSTVEWWSEEPNLLPFLSKLPATR